MPPNASSPLSRAELAQIIVNEMYQLVGILDASGVNLESNQTSLDAAGLKREDVIGKYFWETPWWSEKTRATLKQAVVKAMTGEFVRFEVENMVKDGTIVVDFSLKPVRDASGQVRYIIPEGRDITAKKRAEDEVRRKNVELEKANILLKKQDLGLRVAHAAIERALQTSEERLQLAAETAQLGFWDLNFETGRLFFDHMAEMIFGFGMGEFNGLMNEFYGRVHPIDREVVKKHFETSIKEHSNYNIEYRIMWPEGSQHYVVSKGRATYTPSGKPVRMMGIVIEVTERKLNEMALENRFRELAESMPQIVFTTSSEGVPLYFNQKWFDYTGQLAGSEGAESWTKAIHPDDLERVTTTWQSQSQDHSPLECEFRLRRSDGTYRWHLGRTVPSHCNQGPNRCWYGAITDIDDQKKSQLALTHAVRLRDEFLSIASHELKTPLTSLNLQNQIQRRRLESGELSDNTGLAKKAIEHSEKQIGRLIALIDDMLDVSRIASGKFSLKLEELDLDEVVAESFAQFKPQFQMARCQADLKSDKQIHGCWDRFKIEQALLNLFTNAIKYGAGKPIHVEVRLLEGSAVFSIQDFGIGISPANQSRIFERFERATDLNKYIGLGLGLYITRQIVESHGGTIRVESELGKGSTFIVKLPINPERNNHGS